MSDQRADALAELATWDPMELWGLAELSILFNDDAEPDVRRSFRLRQDVAMELTRYAEHRAKMSAPLKHPIPEDCHWMKGPGPHPTQAWLLEQYPGVAAYFQMDTSTPPPYIWAHIERAALWGIVEKTFLKFLDQRSVVPDWGWWVKAVQQRIVHEHLGIAEEADDLMTLIWAERDKEGEDKIASLNRGIRGAFGSLGD